MPRDPQDPRELPPTPLLEWLRGAIRQALAASDLTDERGRQRVALVLGDYFAALGDALGRYDRRSGPLDRERFGREAVPRDAHESGGGAGGAHRGATPARGPAAR